MAGFRAYSQAGAARERIAVTLFYRATREKVALAFPAGGKAEYRLMSASFLSRPLADAVAELHAVRIEKDHPAGSGDDESTNGLSFDCRWEGIPGLDPMLRVDAIRADGGASDGRTIWQGYLSVRILK